MNGDDLRLMILKPRKNESLICSVDVKRLIWYMFWYTVTGPSAGRVKASGTGIMSWDSRMQIPGLGHRTLGDLEELKRLHMLYLYLASFSPRISLVANPAVIVDPIYLTL